MSILLTLCTTVLILTSLLLILLVLAQKAKSDGGMGAAMGGGMAEATFGADTGNVLSGLTIKAAVVFFVLSISLYLGRIYESKHSAASSGLLPTIAVPASVKTTKAPAGIAMPANAAPAPTPAAKPNRLLKRPAELRWSRGGMRRRCPVLLGAALGLLLLARSPAEPVPDRAAAAALLEQFRESIWSVPIYAEFDLIQMPRRGDETVTRGRFWGSRDEHGPVTRMELAVGPAGFTHRILVQGGPDGGVWTSDGGAPGAASPAALLAPLVPGVETTPFDLLPMPYLYWLDADLVAVQRVRGRAANIYVFTPPGDFAAQYPAVKSVRAYLDTQYDALVQAEVTGPAGRIARTLSLLELRKVGDRWIPKDFDVRNEATRNKTRLSLTGVCLGVAPDPRAFDPAALGTTLAVPPAAKVLRVAP